MEQNALSASPNETIGWMFRRVSCSFLFPLFLSSLSPSELLLVPHFFSPVSVGIILENVVEVEEFVRRRIN